MEIKYDKNNVPKIGGWLYVIALGVFGSFISSILSFINDLNAYLALTPEAIPVENYDSFKMMLLGKIFFVAIISILALNCITEFLKKKIAFKNHYLLLTLLLVFHRIYLFWFLSSFIPAELTDINVVIGRILGAVTYLVIVFLYFKFSLRVRKTFIYQ